MACEPETDLENAGQFSSIIPPGMHAAVQSYLLAKIRGGSMDVAEILREAKCDISCIPPGLLPRIKTWLLCQLSNTGGETPIPVVECVPDADAQAFITAAGLTDETQISALCQLVSDLKTYPAVGTKYWNRDAIIYPIVGGTPSSHAVNLKNPGTNNMVFNGSLVNAASHTVFGMIGDGATGYADTNLILLNLPAIIPSITKDNIRIMMYIDKGETTNSRVYFGCLDGPNICRIMRTTGAGSPWNYAICDATTTTSPWAGIPVDVGAEFIQRNGINTKQAAKRDSVAWITSNVASTGLVTLRNLYILAYNNGAAVFFGNSRISGFSIGSALNDAERIEYKGIWDDFETRIGRGHP